jgi:hypothetical protein
MDNDLFVHFFTPQHRSEPVALFGFLLPLPALPMSDIANAAMQLRLINALWAESDTALELRFVTTSDGKRVIYLLCRVCCLQQMDGRMFQGFCLSVAGRITLLYQKCGYQLQPLSSEEALTYALAPFRIQTLAEVRRCEEIQMWHDAFSKYEVYVPYSWEWVAEEQIAFFEILVQQRTPGLVSIYLEPTRLYQVEQAHLAHVASEHMREFLYGGGATGEAIYEQYRVYEQKLQQPYLMRICLASPSQQGVTDLGEAIREQVQVSYAPPILQFPQNAQEWQTALYNLRYLEWMPWGNLREYTPETARLRYLVDSWGASIAFHLPVKPDPVNRKIKVLLVFANPYYDEKRRLHLGTDDRIIQQAIQLSPYHANISLTILHAATIHDLHRALLKEDFQIVHIASHGSGKAIILEQEGSIPTSYYVPHQPLAEIFYPYSATLECVVLTICDSLALGELITSEISYAIAMEGELGDHEGREFSRGFYDAIGAGKDYDFAYQEGCRRVNSTAAEMMTEKRFMPKIFKKKN